MRRITLDELPAYSPWAARLLGAEPREETADPIARNPKYVWDEYEVRKYRPLLAAVRDRPKLTIAEVRRRDLVNPEREVVMSLGSSLYVAPVERALTYSAITHVTHIWKTVAGGEAKTILDLGCGYGSLLAYLSETASRYGTELRGADISPSAVALARQLGYVADEFSFYDGRCVPLETATPPVVVVTAFALHQLRTARVAVELLARYRDRIAAVVSLEPEARLFGENLLGLMRRRYGELNGYSADLVNVLVARDDVAFVDGVKPNVVGANALLPGTLTVWRFT